MQQMVLQKPVVVDCKGHLLGRLAATLAKELLNGQKVVCVRTEEINISGTLYRNQMLWAHFLRKRMNTNPSRGPFHYRAPSRILWRTIRGMIPHKTARGAAALDRLKAFEGIPTPYDKLKRKVVPNALTTIRLKPGRKFCRLGDLAKSVGWKHGDLVAKLEKKRTLRAAAYFNTKKELTKYVIFTFSEWMCNLFVCDCRIAMLLTIASFCLRLIGSSTPPSATPPSSSPPSPRPSLPTATEGRALMVNLFLC